MIIDHIAHSSIGYYYCVNGSKSNSNTSFHLSYFPFISATLCLAFLYHTYKIALVAHGIASSPTLRCILTSPSTTWNSTPSSPVSSSSAVLPPGSDPSESPTATRHSSPRRPSLSRTRRSCIISLNGPVCTRSTPTLLPSPSPVGVKSTASWVLRFTKIFPEHLLS